VNKIYISIDLELEQAKTNHQTPDSAIDEEKIIQLGAVVFELDETYPKILEKFMLNIHYPHKLSEFITKLTKITSEDVNESDLTLKDAFDIVKNAREKYNASRIMVQWGGGDEKCIEKEYGQSLASLGFGRSAINTKHLYQMYAEMNNLKFRGGLSKSMAQLGLKFECVRHDGKNYGAHNALTDALNTAIVFNHLIFKLKEK
jgi:inhibitor of KinA sporulation pathway (predicted exonuclease)